MNVYDEPGNSNDNSSSNDDNISYSDINEQGESNDIHSPNRVMEQHKRLQLQSF